MTVIKIDIVSDVVCPWCYIGKRRLEKAIEQLSGTFQFQVQYLPFELNPEIPGTGLDQKEHLVKKFGSEAKYQQLTQHTIQVAAEEGLLIDFTKQKVIPNTRMMHAIIGAAGEYGRQLPVADAFFKAYFSDGIDLTRKENLLSVAVSTGLANEVVTKIIEDDSSLVQVAMAENEFRKLGINAVPFYIINNQYGISGAQASETFVKAFYEIATKESDRQPA